MPPTGNTLPIPSSTSFDGATWSSRPAAPARAAARRMTRCFDAQGCTLKSGRHCCPPLDCDLPRPPDQATTASSLSPAT